MEDLRQTIRQILKEELAAQAVRVGDAPGARVREETVTIESDQQLARFVSHLLRMARDPQTRLEIESGRLVFRLASAPTHTAAARRAEHATRSGSVATAVFDRGIVTEKHIHNLPNGTSVVRIGPEVKLTPLAIDAVRHAGITIERVAR